MFVIETDSLSKSIGGVRVLRGLNLRVPSGLVYGLLGPNGAGKTTLIYLLLGFLRPNNGSLRVLGAEDLERIRGRVGYVPERLSYHLRYSAREYLRYLGRFSDMRGAALRARVDETLQAVGLLDVANRQLSTYSKGMLQRFGIAQALLAEPDLLLIDEPTSGLDTSGRNEMVDLLAEVCRRGHTIFLTTPLIEEIEQLCDKMGILFGGTLAAEFDVAALRAPGRSALIRVAQLPAELVLQLQQLSSAVRCDGMEIILEPNSATLQAQTLRLLLDADVPIISLEPYGRPIEDVYMRVLEGRPIEIDASSGVESPPPGMFAPPGHPDAQALSSEQRNARDPLLNELLGRTAHQRESSDHPSETP